MAESEIIMALAKVLVAEAWVDGQVSIEEVNSLKDLWFHVPAMTAHDWAEIDIYIDSPVGEAERARLLEDLTARLSSAADRELALQMVDQITVPSGQGTFYSTPTGPYRRPRYSEIGAGPPENPGSFWNPDTTAGAFYPSYFVAALAAATERGINGSSSAWATVVAGISNWSSWRSGFGSDPLWGAYPRNM